MTCFACEQEPTQQCSRCGRPYCDDHGEELCDACLNPASGVPSFSLYRGSLLALLIGACLSIWLFVQPNSSSGESALRPVVVTPTPAAARTLTTPAPGTTQVPGTTPGGALPTQALAGGTPVGTRPAGTTPAAGATPPATAASGGIGEVEVRSGDTLSAICERVKPTAMTVTECVDRVVALNSLSRADAISVGDKLKVPSR